MKAKNTHTNRLSIINYAFYGYRVDFRPSKYEDEADEKVRKSKRKRSINTKYSMYHFYTIYGECSQTFYLIRWYKLHAWDIEHEPRMKTEWQESASLLALNHFLLDIIACFIAELESCSNLFGIFEVVGDVFVSNFPNTQYYPISRTIFPLKLLRNMSLLSTIAQCRTSHPTSILSIERSFPNGTNIDNNMRNEYIKPQLRALGKWNELSIRN